MAALFSSFGIRHWLQDGASQRNTFLQFAMVCRSFIHFFFFFWNINVFRVEKYRPSSLDQLVSHQDIISTSWPFRLCLCWMTHFPFSSTFYCRGSAAASAILRPARHRSCNSLNECCPWLRHSPHSPLNCILKTHFWLQVMSYFWRIFQVILFQELLLFLIRLCKWYPTTVFFINDGSFKSFIYDYHDLSSSHFFLAFFLLFLSIDDLSNASFFPKTF